MSVHDCQAAVASDDASDPVYADGWQAGDNGGFGFEPWQFANFFDPVASPRPEAQFIATNSFVDIPDHGPAFGQTTGNIPYFNFTSWAIRPFSVPLEVGSTLSIDLDNPVLQPLSEFEFPGMIFRLLDETRQERLGLLAQTALNSESWTIYDRDGDPFLGTDTGLSSRDTAQGGLNYRFTLTGPESYDLVLTALGTGVSYPFSGTLLNAGLPISELEIVIYGTGSSTDGSREFYANNLVISKVSALSGLLIDSPPITMEITGDVEIMAEAEVGVTSGYAQESATIETILAVTQTGTLDGIFANEGKHLRDGIFVDAIHYNDYDVTVDILQAAPGDLNGDRQVDTDDIQLILAANSFNNGSGFDWTQGDNNGDGVVDTLDIQNILAANLFGQPAYAALPANAPVPEPSTVTLAALALLGLLTCGHRRRGA